jgi:hypothetical protein
MLFDCLSFHKTDAIAKEKQQLMPEKVAFSLWKR